MKKLTLDQAWTLCLKQWEWITNHLEEDDVESLKGWWCEIHGYDLQGHCNCFFCAYRDQNTIAGRSCEECPARKVDESFSCLKSDYRGRPIEFYKLLLKLNKQRKGNNNE